jgi:hypothetical protein
MIFLLLSIKSYVSSEGNTQNGQNSRGYGRADEKTLEEGPNIHTYLDGNSN